MRFLLKNVMRIVLIPVWIMLGAIQAVGTVIVNLGNTLFYVLSGLCFLCAIACVGVVGEPISDQRMVLIGGCVFGLLPVFAIGILAAITIMRLVIGTVIFE